MLEYAIGGRINRKERGGEENENFEMQTDND